MSSWNEVLKELNDSHRTDALDFVRRKYIKKLSNKTGRNVIAYYSGFLQRPDQLNTSIGDDDKNGLMAAIHKLDRTKGLDLILHTPGGDMTATESIVDYLHRMFNGNIDCYIPQLAMSGGTMIACACREIIMGKQSCIGPIDPQFRGIPAHGVIAEFEEALLAVKTDPASIPIWQVVVGKYHPTFIGECKNAISMAEDMVSKWLQLYMFADIEQSAEREQKAQAIVKTLNNHSDTKTHSRHINIDEAKAMGLKIRNLEDKQDLQDLVLTIHHAFMHTFANSTAIKIIENQLGNTVVTYGASSK